MKIFVDFETAKPVSKEPHRPAIALYVSPELLRDPNLRATPVNAQNYTSLK